MPLKPAVSALARQTISTAFEELDRTITPADSRDFPGTTLDHVRKAALEIERQLAARQSLRNMRRLQPLFQGLEHYAKVIDVLCNGTPYLAWIWAPITLILRVASEYVEAFEQIIKGYSRISESLKRFELLGNALSKKATFQQTLAVYYADILQFHKHAYKFVRRSSWKLLFLTSWGRFQRHFNNILEDMDRHGTLIDKEAQAHNISDLQQLQQDIYAWKEESQEKASRFEEEQAAKQYQSIISWLKIDESDQLTIFDSISAEGSKYPGTCGWALKNKKIASFLQHKPETHTLWLQGGPGSGKSVLSTQLVNFMKTAKTFVISHFCTNLAPAVPTLERTLHTLLTSISQEPRQIEYIWMFVDGLNECDARTQASVVTLINQITSRPQSSTQVICRVLISSRASPAISSRLRKKQVLSLAEEKESMGLAIKHYTSQRLLSLQEKFNQLHLNPNEIDDIRDEITRKSDGMFLYARLVLNFLDNKIFYKGSEVKASVNELPEELSDFYRKILTQILVRLDAQSVNRVKSIFCWIAFAKRPLKRIEFLSAISFSAGDPDVTHLAPTYILDFCGALVEERRDNTLAFIHVSVKEFLQSSSSHLVINEREAAAEQAIAAITCLLSGSNIFTKPCQNDIRYLRVARGLHGFHAYSTEYWIDYLLYHATSTSHNKLSKVERVLWAKSLKGLESGLQPERFPNNDVPSINLSPQDVSFLLTQNDYPGVSAEELESFKSQFRGSAYTCRLASCPRAFESEALRLGHEMTHLPRFQCNFPGCQNPPFVSAQALKNHEKKYHASQPARRSIRRDTITPGIDQTWIDLTASPMDQVNQIPSPGDATRATPMVFHNSRDIDEAAKRAQERIRTAVNQSKKITNQTNQIPNPGDTTSSPQHSSEPITNEPEVEEDFKLYPSSAADDLYGFPTETDSSVIYNPNPQLAVPLPLGPPSYFPLGSMRAPDPRDKSAPSAAPLAPSWLQVMLINLRRNPDYDAARFEGVMCYSGFDFNTGIPYEFRMDEPIPTYIKFYWVPRIVCHDCKGDLTDPGPGMTLENFEAHLKTPAHRANVVARVSNDLEQRQLRRSSSVSSTNTIHEVSKAIISLSDYANTRV
ncbi:hypothetical protein F4805DRAFT_469475 [Annulohypoxylon moriforme]|nr:hypothetical protein F4805DRAFT_469475 [Annulohypoxylon moriforme]